METRGAYKSFQRISQHIFWGSMKCSKTPIISSHVSSEGFSLTFTYGIRFVVAPDNKDKVKVELFLPKRGHVHMGTKIDDSNFDKRNRHQQ